MFNSFKRASIHPKECMDPKIRQEAVKDLLSKELISDQNRLVELLKIRYKIDTNQAVVSRDLRKLGVVKKQVAGVMVYEMPTVDVVTEILKLAIAAIEHNETTIVIKTHAGLAAFVGDCLDQYTDLDIIGCVSGENVVIVVPRSIKNVKKICKSVCEKVQFRGSHV